MLNAASLLLWLAAVSFLSVILVGALTLSGSSKVEGVIAFGGYALAFLVFVVGFGAWARSRSPGSAMPRVLLLLALFLAIVGPWVIMAIAGVFAGGSDAMVLAAPSPAYAFYLLEAVSRTHADREAALAAGTVCAAAWLLLGLGLLALAASTSARRVKEERTLREQLENALDQELSASEGQGAETASAR